MQKNLFPSSPYAQGIKSKVNVKKKKRKSNSSGWFAHEAVAAAAAPLIYIFHLIKRSMGGWGGQSSFKNGGPSEANENVSEECRKG